VLAQLHAHAPTREHAEVLRDLRVGRERSELFVVNLLNLIEGRLSLLCDRFLRRLVIPGARKCARTRRSHHETSSTTLDFFSRSYIAYSALQLIKERSIQSTLNNPLHIREVKPVLSRSYALVLWISASRAKFEIEESENESRTGRREPGIIASESDSDDASAL
jgi:hypothetical protein